tara:strand:- start:41325 stop:41828 length:504 start_codon:yes stop_codon:yes gene_type:complete
MGWLFGKKKEPKVPFPKGHQVGEDVSRDTLHFSAPTNKERVIQPHKVKEVVGKPVVTQAPKAPEVKIEPVKALAKPVVPMPPKAKLPAAMGGSSEPLYIKMNVYQHIIDNLAELHHEILNFKHISKKIDESEFNEESKLMKLRRSMKSTHDHLLHIDQKLFKMNTGR